MKRFNPAVWALASAVGFVVMLLLSSFRPFVDDRPIARRVLLSAVIAVVGGAVTSWQAGRSPRRRQAVLELDQDTAARVDALLTEGKKVQAAKAVRDAIDTDLQTAVNTVEARRP